MSNSKSMRQYEMIAVAVILKLYDMYYAAITGRRLMVLFSVTSGDRFITNFNLLVANTVATLWFIVTMLLFVVCWALCMPIWIIYKMLHKETVK